MTRTAEEWPTCKDHGAGPYKDCPACYEALAVVVRAQERQLAAAEDVRRAVVKAVAQLGSNEHQEAHLTLYEALRATGKANVKLLGKEEPPPLLAQPEGA